MVIYWDDLLFPSATNSILTKVTGVDGSRIFSIQWRGGALL